MKKRNGICPKKYQILSKNTALFTEILNEEKQQSKLIKVNSVNCVIISIMQKPMPFMSNMMNPMMQMDIINLMIQHMMMMQQQMMTQPQNVGSDGCDNNNSSSTESYLAKENNNLGETIKLIFSQNVIEGSWDENDETTKIIDIIRLDKFTRIKNEINAMNKGKNTTKIIYTILVI